MAAASTDPATAKLGAAEPQLLALSEVSAGYGSFRALFGVSLSVNLGEAVGVIDLQATRSSASQVTLRRAVRSWRAPATVREDAKIASALEHDAAVQH